MEKQKRKEKRKPVDFAQEIGDKWRGNYKGRRMLAYLRGEKDIKESKGYK
tara:strand:- start:178 stop:327 length:150 start_codon:yes stop_codon:yes gene_type:complete